jgi:hypothetical protein
MPDEIQHITLMQMGYEGTGLLSRAQKADGVSQVSGNVICPSGLSGRPEFQNMRGSAAHLATFGINANSVRTNAHEQAVQSAAAANVNDVSMPAAPGGPQMN